MSAQRPPAEHVAQAAYVYYRVPVGREAAVLSRVATLFKTLMATQPGLQTRLMHKLDAAVLSGAEHSTAGATWMEVYEHPQGVSVACLRRMKEMAQTLLADQTGPRHLELFAPVPVTGDGLA